MNKKVILLKQLIAIERESLAIHERELHELEIQHPPKPRQKTKQERFMDCYNRFDRYLEKSRKRNAK